MIGPGLLPRFQSFCAAVCCRAGDVIRIAVQLLDTDTGRQLWADRHDVTAGNLFAVQEKIAEQVASAMKIGVDRSPRVTIILWPRAK